MEFAEKLTTRKKSIMVLGTSSGVGKSITVTAICRMLRDIGDRPVPFKGQNMSNNAWVDSTGGEMAYSQALQAFAAGIIPSSEMNPILIKPQGDSTSEVIHLGKSVGITTAKNYYESWFNSGWEVVKKGIDKILEKNKDCRLIIEGAGSPVEMNLIHRDLTNLKIAKYLNADCILVADIERGGVFAQIVGTLNLMQMEERNLIKGIIINRFRGDFDLFYEGKNWIEDNTGIPVLGIMPSLDDKFPPEDSLDILDNQSNNQNSDINLGIIKFPSISNFSDFDPLENEDSIQIKWIKKSQELEKFDLIILPGSKQTIKDHYFLKETGLQRNIKDYFRKNGNILGICGGLQMLGSYLVDPYFKEGSNTSKDEYIKGIGLLPLKTIFLKNKKTNRINCKSKWPCETNIEGFEIHNGISDLSKNPDNLGVQPLYDKKGLGWYLKIENQGTVTGSYIHGIFENDIWRNSFLNMIREQKGLPILDKIPKNYKIKRERIINNLTQQFKKHINISLILN
tara:strand:+ start:2146 stop:3675 length:1530 start_codon:yes stop_codon:yes gene_type:complete